MPFKRVRFSLALAIFITCLPGGAQTAAQQRIALSPQVRHGTLPNGLQWYAQRNERPSAKVEMRLVLKAGSMQEDDDQLGLAHFAEHMAFGGTRHFEKNKLISTMQGLGMRMGADLNAFTGFDQTLYVLSIPTDRPQNVEQGLQVLADWAGGVTFDPAEIERERGVVLEESRNHKGAGDRMNRVLYPKIFEGSRYAERLAIGKDELLRTFPHAALTRYYRDWYRPNLMAVILVGDVDPLTAEAMVRRYFGGLKNPVTERARIYTPIPDRTREEAVVVTDPEATANVLRVIYSHNADAPDSTVGRMRREFVKSLFNAMMSQRLQSAARGSSPVFASARIGLRPFVRGYEQFSADITLSKAGLDPAASALALEAARVRENGFIEAELERARKSLLRTIEQAYNERDKTESAALANALIRHVLTGEPAPGIEQEHAQAQNFVPQITLAEVNEFARKLFSDSERKLVIYQGGEKSGETAPTQEALLRAVNAKPFWVSAYTERAPAGVLMDKPPEGGRIASERLLADL
ncbi:MAG TPA: pitrilysin family protein, partial [Burkholderiaceae bacterium]